MDKIKAYTGSRPEIAQFVAKSAKRILDVGCSTGAIGAALKAQNEAYVVIGIEGDQTLAETAKNNLDHVIIADLNHFNNNTLANQDRFDSIILADVLEHLINPSELLNELVENHLRDDGNLIISLPNVSHILAIRALLAKKWPQEERGLFDKTHLRWFAIKNIYEMLENANLRVSELHRNYRIVDDWKKPINRWSRYIAMTPLKDYITYQYVINTHKN